MLESQLKQLILSKYKSLRAFTIAIDVPYSTIDTMLKRGIGGASVTTVLKVCKALDLDADELAEGRITSKSNLINTPNTKDEEKILSMYRQLDSYGKDMLTTVLQKELDRTKIQSSNSTVSKKISSFNSQSTYQTPKNQDTEFGDMSIEELEEEYKKINSNSASNTVSTVSNITDDENKNQKQAK